MELKPMLEAHLETTKSFKQIIESVSALVDECSMKFDEDGLTIDAMDSAHTSVLALKILKDGFVKYECTELCTLGIKMANLNKILKSADPKDKLILEHTTHDKLNIKFETSKGKVSKFDMKLMTMDEDDNFDIPEKEPECSLSMSSSEFKKIIGTLKDFGETCNITMVKEDEKDTISFGIDGDIATAEVSITNEDEDVEIVIDSEIENGLHFAMNNLDKLTKATPLSANVEIELSENFPLVAVYNLNHGFLKYYIGPKTEDD